MTNKVDFDNYAENYEKITNAQLSKFDIESEYFSRYKVLITKKILGDKHSRILDFGTGIGRSLPILSEIFEKSSLYGSDTSIKSVELARINNPKVTVLDEPSLLAINDNYFNLIFTACVFHHINPKDRDCVMKTIFDKTAHGGKFIIFEHNIWNPVTRHMVKTCPFDADAVLLRMSELVLLLKNSGFKIYNKGYTLFFPAPLRLFRPLEKYLSWLPLGGQYYIVCEKI